MIDAKELATDALVNHWPAHLGVNTDAEKIELLARTLETITGISAEAENSLQVEIDRLEGERTNDEYRITQLETAINKVEEAIKGV